MIQLKFINKSDNPNPEYKHDGDSGFDLRAFITDTDTRTLLLRPNQRMKIHTGLYFDIPEHCEIQVRPRSGCSILKGLTVINSPGTADSNYTGELCVLAINLSDEDIIIDNGDRIAQAVLCPVFGGGLVDLSQTDNIEKDTQRGSNGFNSTGVK